MAKKIKKLRFKKYWLGRTNKKHDPYKPKKKADPQKVLEALREVIKPIVVQAQNQEIPVEKAVEKVAEKVEKVAEKVAEKAVVPYVPKRAFLPGLLGRKKKKAIEDMEEDEIRKLLHRRSKGYSQIPLHQYTAYNRAQDVTRGRVRSEWMRKGGKKFYYQCQNLHEKNDPVATMKNRGAYRTTNPRGFLAPRSRFKTHIEPEEGVFNFKK